MAYQVQNKGRMLQKKESSNNNAIKIARLARDPSMVNRFSQVIGDKAPAFLAGVVGAVNSNGALRDADPDTVMASAMVAATLDLSCVPSLGQSALVPYKGKVQFQVMTRGLVQLAQRTGQYKAINTGKVYEDEYDGEDMLSGEVKFHRVIGGFRDQGKEDKVIGYFAFIRTVTGFEHTEYWTKDDVINHARTFSQSFETGPWATHFDRMAEKTVLKSCLNHYGPMSVDSVIAKAIAKDQVVVDKDGNESYADNPLSDSDMEVTEDGELVEEPKAEEEPAAPAEAPAPEPAPEPKQEAGKYDEVEEI